MIRGLATAFVAAILVVACSGNAATTAPTAAPAASDGGGGGGGTPVESAGGGGGGAPGESAETGGGSGGQDSGGGAVRSLDELAGATIQIEAEGSFIDPAQGALTNVAGRGSGVIVDPSGIAITANHVVTGAATLKVWVGGDREKTYNAQVLATSECSDLAVIKIAGDGFPYVRWFDGEPKVGLDVYAAGFPLGDPEYTLNRGIISKARADGESSWSSVDSVIEHDALINPGNSGGPLVTGDGELVGINYAGNSVGQSFAIGKAEADRVLPSLMDGKNVTWIGINGEAVSFDGGGTGIWVFAVESGSPADRAGISGGDVLTRLEGLVLATDGTMADYCDVLRTHDSTDVMSFEVLDPNTGETTQDQLNRP